MNSWNAMTYDGRDNLVRVVRAEARRFFELVAPTETWEQPTACANWQVRDVVGHLVDTTESYFVAFDAALKVRASEPLMLDALGGHAADLGWGLTCQSSGCFALAAPSHCSVDMS